MTAPRRASPRPAMLSVVIACALPVLIFLAYSQWHFAGVSKRATLELMEASADSLALAVSQEVERTVALLQVVGNSRQLDLSDTQFLRLANSLAVSVGQGSWVALLDKELQPFALTRDVPPSAIRVYKAQALRAMESLRPQLARVSGMSVRFHNQVLLAVPLFRAEDGQVEGVALMGVPPETFEQQLTHNVLPKGWRAVLTEDEYAHDHERQLALAARHPWRDSSPFNSSTSNNLMVVRKVLGTPWHVDLTAPAATVQAETWQDLAPNFVAGTIFLLLAALVGSAAARRVARPMTELAELARKLSEEAPSDKKTPGTRVGDAASVASALEILFSRGKEARLELVRTNEALRHLTQTLEHRVEERTQALDQAKKSAEQTSKEITDFLFQLQYDVKMPLARLLEVVDLLLAETDNATTTARLALIRRGAEAMDVQLSDLLELATLDVETLELQAEVFSPAVVLQGVIRLFDSSVSQRSNSLTVQSSELPRYVRGDAHRLAQVLRSLIAYLNKFAKGHTIRVRGWGAPEGGTLHFAVSDTGRAQSDEAAAIDATLPLIPADSSALSLVVCKRLVEAMGGALHIDNVEDVGTRFHVQVAMTTEAEHLQSQESLAAPTAQLKGHVLVADDNALNRVLAEAVLARWGLTVEGVDNGVLAVERVLSRPFDAVFLDLQMPEADGFEAARRIRAQAERLPLLIAMSADSNRLSRYDGPLLFDDFFAKPTEWPAVLARLSAVLVESPPPELSAQKVNEEQYAVLDASRQESLLQQMGLLRLKPFLQALPTGLTAQVQQVTQAHARADYAVMAAAAHGLAEAASFAGCLRLARVARDLPAYRSNADLAQLQWVLNDTLRAIHRWVIDLEEKKPNLRRIK